MMGVLPSRELGARASGAHGAGTITGGRSQAQAPAPGGIHGRPGQMINHNLYPIRKPWITRLPSFLPPSMHYPQLVSTTCVSAGITAMGAVVGDWPDGSAQLQPCRHVLDGLPDPLVMRVSGGVECGSHAAAPAVLTIRRVAYRSPSWSRRCWMCSCRSSSWSGMHAIAAGRRYVAPGSCLRTSGHGQPLPAVARMPPRRLEARATGSAGSLLDAARHVGNA
jgi:hypothetical protein